MALLRPSRPGVLADTATDPHVIAEVILRVGEQATAWAIETAYEMPMSDAVGLSGRPSDKPPRNEKAEVFGLWAVIVLGGGTHPPTSLLTRLVNGVLDGLPRMLSLEQSFLGLQTAHAYFVDKLFDTLGADEAAQSTHAAMKQISLDMTEGLHSLSARLAQRFDAERGRWMSTRTAIEHETTLAVLTEDAVIDIDKASDRLGYDLRAEHVALVAWSVGSTTDDTKARLCAVAEQALRDLGCRSVLVVPADPGRVWAWGRTDDESRSLAEEPTVPAGARIAVGLPAHGVSGFRVSHAQAKEAERIACSVPVSTTSVFDFHALEVFGLLSPRPAALSAFVERELGALARNGPTEDALRETLLCYLENDRSLSAVAAQLHIAKNTVLHRVRRSEQLRGRPVQQDKLRLLVALHVCDVLRTMGVDAPDGPSDLRRAME
ncbi:MULTISPECIES: PucR family transcriptional regulator [unclassified Streptomyces]|uniref:PucR family transcriptional regulator n=1 Tax=unclassified Streptomyces TaxID=2593676 RepID=UPI003821BC82